VKLIAAILLLSFSSFTVERMVVPSVCMAVEKGSKMKCKKAGCCKKMAMMGEKHSKKGKSKTATECTDCPLCVVLIDHHTVQAIVITTTSRSFGLLQVKDIADHSYRQWKPPNA
jgi:hypothetical protein